MEPSFPRKRESRRGIIRDYRPWMPACAGMTNYDTVSKEREVKIPHRPDFYNITRKRDATIFAYPSIFSLPLNTLVVAQAQRRSRHGGTALLHLGLVLLIKTGDRPTERVLPPFTFGLENVVRCLDREGSKTRDDLFEGWGREGIGIGEEMKLFRRWLE